MDVYVLNASYEPVAVIDSFKSLIWTKRYFACGDFELYIPADKSLLEYLQPDNFLVRDDDDSVMVIEKLLLQTDAESGISSSFPAEASKASCIGAFSTDSFCWTIQDQ